jgi:predicted PurR-regulated permease PerM
VTNSQTPTPRLATGDLVRASIATIAVLVTLVVLWQTRVLMLLTLLSALLGIAATPAVDWLAVRRIKRGLGAPLVVLGTVAFVVAVGLWAAPTVVSQVNQLRVQMPASIDKVDAYLEREHSALINAILPRDESDTVTAPDGRTGTTTSGRLARALMGQVSSLRGLVFTTVTSTLAGFAALVYVVFLTMYIAIEPDAYRRGLLLLVPVTSRDRGALVFDAVTATLRRWLATQFIAMVVIGLVTTLVLLLLGVKSAIPLGILAGILEFVPNIGPLMSAIPSVLVAFADSPQKALLVIIAYWGIQFLENNLLIPHLMREELDLPPALTLLWQALMAIMFGILGLFVAVPLLAAGFVTVRYVYVRGDVPAVRKPRGSREFHALPDEPAQP